MYTRSQSRVLTISVTELIQQGISYIETKNYSEALNVLKSITTLITEGKAWDENTAHAALFKSKATLHTAHEQYELNDVITVVKTAQQFYLDHNTEDSYAAHLHQCEDILNTITHINNLLYLSQHPCSYQPVFFPTIIVTPPSPPAVACNVPTIAIVLKAKHG